MISEWLEKMEDDVKQLMTWRDFFLTERVREQS